MNKTFVLLPILAMMLAACGGSNNSVPSGSASTTSDPSVSAPAPDVPVTGVTVSAAGSVTSLAIGKTLQLTATVAPEDATNKAVTWSSDAADKASISASGLVSALAKATSVVFTATSQADNTKKGTYTLEIKEIPVESVTVNAPMGTTKVTVGKTVQLVAVVAPTDASDKSVIWETSNTELATIDSNGLVSGIADSGANEVTFTATSVADETKKDSISLPIVPQTDAEHHAEYLAHYSDNTYKMNFAAKIVGIEQYSGNTKANISLQKGIYGYRINNVLAKYADETPLVVGDSISFEAVGSAKTYPSFNRNAYTDAVTKLDTPVATTGVNLSTSADDFANSQNALISMNNVVLTAASATEASFTYNENTYKLSYNTGTTVEKAAIAEIFGTLAVGSKVNFFGNWFAQDTVRIDHSAGISLVQDTPTSVAVSAAGDKTSIVLAETLQMSAVVSPSGASQIVEWSVVDGTGHGNIDENGLFTPTLVGTVSIKATCVGHSDINDSYSLTIEATPALDHITVTNPTKTSYQVGQQLDATGLKVVATYGTVDVDVTDSVTYTPALDYVFVEADIGKKAFNVHPEYADATKDKTFEITVTAAVDTVYTKVTADQADWSGQYLIVYETGNLAFDGSLEALDVASNTKSVTIADSSISVAGASNNFYFTVAAVTGGYSIQSASGKYINDKGSDANGLVVGDTASVNVITFVSADDISVAGANLPHLRYNAAGDQARFRYYKSSTYTAQKAIQLYKLAA